MEPTEFYQTIASSIKEEDLRKVASLMVSHVGEENLITLEDIAIEIYGEFNKTTERKVRLVLEELVSDKHMPVCAYSGRSGRWLAKDDDERNKAIYDLESRYSSLQKRIYSLRLAVVPAKAPNFEKSRQQRLWR